MIQLIQHDIPGSEMRRLNPNITFFAEPGFHEIQRPWDILLAVLPFEWVYRRNSMSLRSLYVTIGSEILSHDEAAGELDAVSPHNHCAPDCACRGCHMLGAM